MKNYLSNIEGFELCLETGGLPFKNSDGLNKLILLGGFRNRKHLVETILGSLCKQGIDDLKNHKIDLSAVVAGLSVLPLSRKDIIETENSLKDYFESLITYSIIKLRREYNSLASQLREFVNAFDESSKWVDVLFAVKFETILRKPENEEIKEDINTAVQYKYWLGTTETLIELERKLIENDLIKCNPNFLETFRSEKILNEQKRTIWKRTRPEAYFLLYKIYDNLMIEGENIGKIADKLFVFSGKNSPEVSTASFSKFCKQLNGKYFTDYKNKKLRVIDNLNISVCELQSV